MYTNDNILYYHNSTDSQYLYYYKNKYYKILPKIDSFPHWFPISPNSTDSQYLYWDHTHSTYLPVPTQEGDDSKPQDKKEKDKDKQDKVLIGYLF